MLFAKHQPVIEPLEARIAPAATGLAIGRALDLPGGIAVSVTGDPAAVATQSLGTTGQLLGFPSGSDGDFLILSTGIATHVSTLTNSGDSQGTDLGPRGSDGDEVSVRFTLPVPVVSGEQRLKLDFMFLTEEFPEFVGAGFNDTFEVLINGVNQAKDEFGHPIDVDNAFFSGEAAPGTFFDGRTNKLTLNYTIPNGVTSLDIEMRLTDIGDGVLDSAVLVDNVRFESPQVVFLDFDGATVLNHFGVGVTGILPAFSAADIGSADATGDIITQLFAKVQALYADYDILFTMSQPAGGEYSTLVIGGNNDILLDLTGASVLTQQQAGGTSATLRDFFNLGADSILGLAGVPDVGNLDHSDQAVIFSGEFDNFFSGETVEARLDHLAVTIAHELGHALGLRHVEDANFGDIMKQNAPRDTGAEFGETLLTIAETWSDGVTLQNAEAYLTSVLGKSGGSALSPALAQQTGSFSTTSGMKLYDVTISIQLPGNESAPLTFHFDQFDAKQNLQLPALPVDATITLTASSAQGGATDVFSGKSVGGALDAAATAVPLFKADGALAGIPLSKSNGSTFSPLGSLPLKPNDLGDVKLAPKGVVKLTDADGDIYTIRLTGPGLFGYVLDDPDHDGKGGLSRLVLDDTTLASQLVITVAKAKGGDGFVDFEEISGTLGAALKSLDARGIDLTAEGISFAGAVRTVWIHDLSDGANIYTGTAAGVVSTVKAHAIGDGSNVAIGTDVGSFSAAEFGESSLTVPSLKNFLLTGDAKAAIEGDFGGNAEIAGVLGKFSVHDISGGARIKAGGYFFDSTVLVMHEVADGAVINLGSAVASLTAAKIGDAAFKADAFGKVVVTGDKGSGLKGDVAGDFSAEGGFTQLRAHDILGTASITAGGISTDLSTFTVHEIRDGASISVETTITAFTAARIGSATLHAAAVTLLTVSGDAKTGLAGDFNATLSLSGGDVPFDNTLAVAIISGGMTGAKLTLDSIGQLSARSLIDSSIFAGFSPTNAGEPMDGGVFFAAGLIKSLTITGSIDAVANSIIAGSVVKEVKFRSLVSDNGGDAFGIISGGPLKQLSVPGFTYHKAGPADQSLGDFHVIRV